MAVTCRTKLSQKRSGSNSSCSALTSYPSQKWSGSNSSCSALTSYPSQKRSGSNSSCSSLTSYPSQKRSGSNSSCSSLTSYHLRNGPARTAAVRHSLPISEKVNWQCNRKMFSLLSAMIIHPMSCSNRFPGNRLRKEDRTLNQMAVKVGIAQLF